MGRTFLIIIFVLGMLASGSYAAVSKFNPLRVTSPSELSPAHPNTPYKVRLTARGGKHPHTWFTKNSQFDQPRISEEGDLEWTPNEYIKQTRFIVVVTDTRGVTAEKLLTIRVVP